MEIDTNALSIKELEDQLSAIKSALNERRNAERLNDLASVKSMVARHGFTPDEIFKKNKEVKKPTNSRRAAAVKYRHPENPELKWSGRGKTPRWIVEFQSSGRLIDECLI